jgi:hypothetical protein
VYPFLQFRILSLSKKKNSLVSFFSSSPFSRPWGRKTPAAFHPLLCVLLRENGPARSSPSRRRGCVTAATKYGARVPAWHTSLPRDHHVPEFPIERGSVYPPDGISPPPAGWHCSMREANPHASLSDASRGASPSVPTGNRLHPGNAMRPRKREREREGNAMRGYGQWQPLVRWPQPNRDLKATGITKFLFFQ